LEWFFRTQFFGVSKSDSTLLVVPKDDSSYLLFNAFDEEGNVKGADEEIAESLVGGLAHDAFGDCADAKKSVVGD
jgi:hypothetical protein